MEAKPADTPSIFSVVVGGGFKRTPSELDLEEFLQKAVGSAAAANGEEDVKPMSELIWCQRDHKSSFAEIDAFLAGAGVASDDLDGVAFRNPVSALTDLATSSCG